MDKFTFARVAAAGAMGAAMAHFGEVLSPAFWIAMAYGVVLSFIFLAEQLTAAK